MTCLLLEWIYITQRNRFKCIMVICQVLSLGCILWKLSYLKNKIHFIINSFLSPLVSLVTFKTHKSLEAFIVWGIGVTQLVSMSRLKAQTRSSALSKQDWQNCLLVVAHWVDLRVNCGVSDTMILQQASLREPSSMENEMSDDFLSFPNDGT